MVRPMVTSVLLMTAQGGRRKSPAHLFPSCASEHDPRAIVKVSTGQGYIQTSTDRRRKTDGTKRAVAPPMRGERHAKKRFVPAAARWRRPRKEPRGGTAPRMVVLTRGSVLPV